MNKEIKKKKEIITINAEDVVEFAKLPSKTRKKRIKEVINQLLK